MKRFNKIREKGKGIIDTVIRYPLMIILLVAAVVSNTIAINNQDNDPYMKLLITFLLGASIYAVFQMIYERFFSKPFLRIIFMGITIVLSLLYYMLIKDAGFDVEITLRTIVILFILLIAFLWIPTIKSRINFNQSFMAAFKAFFMAAFFNGVLFLGIVLILSVTDLLIFNINEKAYMHSANIIFILFASIHFFSMIPYYPRKAELDAESQTKQKSAVQLSEGKSDLAENVMDETIEEEKVKREEALVKLTAPAKFLEALISYVIIPITAVFTIVLLIYIIINITGEFWTDNMLEPLLVAYSIVVIIVYLLASTIDNAFSKYFRMIFPKVLLPIVLFQTISSVLKIQDAGISYGRYYVIMFGVFATFAGIWFSIKPIQKNGFIAPILIILSVISILPLIDVFTISRANQLGRLVNVLEQNDMFNGEMVTPKEDITDKDKQIIINSVHYLNSMEYTQEIDWLSDYSKSYDFEGTFGFAEYGYTRAENENHYVIIARNQSAPIPIAGYDFMAHINVYNNTSDKVIDNYVKNGKTYTLRLESLSEHDQIITLKEAGTEIIRFSMKDIYNNYGTDNEKTEVETTDVTFTQENDTAALTVVAEAININSWKEGMDEQADVYILVKIK